MSTSGQNLAGISSAMDMEDVWDDSELIKEYNKAVKYWRKPQEDKVPEETSGPGPWVEVSKTKVADDKQLAVPVATFSTQQRSLSPTMLEVSSWIVGAPCRAIYSEDGVEYEAKILGIEGPSCVVRFIGYGNEEEVHLTDLKTTHGKKSRDKQRREAQVYHQSVNGGEEVDRASNISLTSSMCNNYTDSVCRYRDVEETLTESSAPLQSSTPRNGGAHPRLPRSFEKLTLNLDNQNYYIPPPKPEDNLDSGVPSAAGATIDSSSSLSSGVAEGPQEAAAANLSNDDWDSFNNTMPQSKFPVPPIPLSLSHTDGRFDFGRGELPALLMSWYMAGYQAGFFDAKRELSHRGGSNSRSARR